MRATVLSKIQLKVTENAFDYMKNAWTFKRTRCGLKALTVSKESQRNIVSKWEKMLPDSKCVIPHSRHSTLFDRAAKVAENKGTVCTRK